LFISRAASRQVSPDFLPVIKTAVSEYDTALTFSPIFPQRGRATGENHKGEGARGPSADEGHERKV